MKNVKIRSASSEPDGGHETFELRRQRNPSQPGIDADHFEQRVIADADANDDNNSYDDDVNAIQSKVAFSRSCDNCSTSFENIFARKSLNENAFALEQRQQ